MLGYGTIGQHRHAAAFTNGASDLKRGERIYSNGDGFCAPTSSPFRAPSGERIRGFRQRRDTHFSTHTAEDNSAEFKEAKVTGS